MAIGEQVRFLRRTIHRRLTERLAERSKVPVSRLWILGALHRQAIGSQAELADLLYVDAPTLSRSLDKLQAEGLLTREPGVDRRKFALVLTPAGLAEAKTVDQALNWIDTRIGEHLSPSELAELERLLEKAVLALGGPGPAPREVPGTEGGRPGGDADGSASEEEGADTGRGR